MSEGRAVDDSSTFGRDDLSSSNEMDVRAVDAFRVWADNDDYRKKFVVEPGAKVRLGKIDLG